MKNQKHWIAVISKEHAMRGANGNFIQAYHGKRVPLKRMRKEGRIIVYSPKFTMEGNEKCQSFIAIGQA